MLIDVVMGISDFERSLRFYFLVSSNDVSRIANEKETQRTSDRSRSSRLEAGTLKV
jgi:hypothetical protein